MTTGKTLEIKNQFKGLLEEANAILRKEIGRYLHANEKSRKEKKKIPEADRFSTSLDFSNAYRKWYTRSYYLMKELAPERLPEFHACYYPDSRRKELSITNYTIKDYITGVYRRNPLNNEPQFNIFNCFLDLFHEQLGLLLGVEEKLDSLLANVRGVLQAEIFDSELQASRELLRHGFLRAAGVVAGVALEAHLTTVCGNHGCEPRKKNPSISDYNEALKDKGITDVPVWRRIQALYDVRTICAHTKKRDPTPEEVDDLIDGVERLTKSLF